MKKFSIFLFFLSMIANLSVISCVTQSAQAPNAAALSPSADWQPARTWVFFAGLLEWKDQKEFPSFPKENRRDQILYNVLRERGVPANQMLFLKDEDVTTANVTKIFPNFLSRARAGDTIIIYFSGHGYKADDYETTFLATYDANPNNSGWQTSAIPAAIERHFKGAKAIILADNCFSGALVEDVKELENPRVSYAVMTSTHFNSSSTGNWTFTESLIYAFRGDAWIDDDGDGKITFAELEANAAEDMLFAEEQITQFLFTGDFDETAIVAAAPKKQTPRLGERVEISTNGDFYKGFILAAKNDKFKVRYYGYEESDDEWIAADKIRRATPKQYKIGAKVQVQSDEEWLTAKILNVKGGSHFIAYEDYDEQYDEWVSTDRIRKIR